MAKKKQGGNPKKAGRKPVEDKAVQFCIYPRQSVIDAIGLDNAKAIAMEALEKAAKRIKKQ